MEGKTAFKKERLLPSKAAALAPSDYKAPKKGGKEKKSRETVDATTSKLALAVPA